MKFVTTGAALAAVLALAACDNSPQNADGTTQQGDLGVAATTGVPADTGNDTGKGPDIGAAGEVSGVNDTDATNTGVNSGGETVGHSANVAGGATTPQ